MTHRTNLISLTERRDDDGSFAASVTTIDELLVLLQELGEFARRARNCLPTHPRQQTRAFGRGAAERGGTVSDRPNPAERPLHPQGPQSAETERDGDADSAPKKLQLTQRQQEVLDLLRQGMSNRRIGRSLHITEQTVKAHLHMIYHKLGAADRTEAVVIAMHHGLVSQQRTTPPSA